jgi:peptidoglycan/xylan/chitin deacetylase (PgdA/CDA1 family)
VRFVVAALLVLASASLARAIDGDGDPFHGGVPAGGRIVSGIAAHRVIHFTFDDGPEEHTPRLLDVLDAHHVRATFFLVGFRVAQRPDVAREILRRGHAIGMHSYAHHDYTRMTPREVASDMSRAEAVFTSVFGATPHMVRPPYGRHDAHVDAAIADRGYTQVRWNLTADGHVRTREGVLASFRAMLDAQRDVPGGEGGILLLHDTHPWVVDAVPGILDELDARNCAALVSGEEMWDVVGDLGEWFDPRHYASPSSPALRMRLTDEELAARQAELRVAAEERCLHAH